jgi:signal peptidase I
MSFPLNIDLKGRTRMVAVSWREFKGLAFHPSEVFEELLGRHCLAVSLTLGMISYYLGTLQVSELLLPQYLGGLGYTVLNAPLALGRMLFIVSLIHGASRLMARQPAPWMDLLTIWGYTQVPYIALTALALASLIIVPWATRIGEPMLWMILVGGTALPLFLWGLILKLQALQTCYQLRGGRLVGAIAIALLLNISFLWLERTFLYERGLVPRAVLQGMDRAAAQEVIGGKNLALPFDTLTYHLRAPIRGEIVGFVPPGQEVSIPLIPGFRIRSMGRVVGLPGEKVEVKEGALFINSRPVNEPYRANVPEVNMLPAIVPPGHVFILGDNRQVPMEVSGVGMVPQRAIRGRFTEVGRLKWRLTVGTWLW